MGTFEKLKDEFINRLNSVSSKTENLCDYLQKHHVFTTHMSHRLRIVEEDMRSVVFATDKVEIKDSINKAEKLVELLKYDYVWSKEVQKRIDAVYFEINKYLHENE